MCGLLVIYKNSSKRDAVNEKILTQIGEQLMFANRDDITHAYSAFIVSNLLAASEILRFALFGLGCKGENRPRTRSDLAL